MSNAWRKPALAASKGLGRLQRRGSRGPWPFAVLLAAVVAFLALTPVLLNLLVSLIPDASRRRFGIDAAPAVRDWLSLANVALAFAAVATVRALARARERVIVEGFVDYTKEDAKAVSGLATLRVTELGRLRELVRHVDTDVAIPAAVGVERRGGFGRAKEAAGFLTASADNLTNVLEGAVASDAKLELGALRIPVGPALSLLNRVARGPRVVGSVHRTEAGGGPTLTAQLVGGGSSGTWRVDRRRQPETAAEERAFLDTMVRELACRMFTELSLEDSGRWRAVAAFTEYLRLYQESFRTPRDRACSLKQAEAKLLEAVAEDESFGLAYYNLGVIYTKLAQAELSAERASHDLSRPGEVNPIALEATRKEAARVAFWRASERSPELWQAHYALAVTLFSAMAPVKVDERLRRGDGRRELLEQVIRGCDQALALRPPARSSTAVVRDLRGMAAVRLGTPERDGSGRFRDGMRDHRTAVAHSWRELCRAERLARAVPGVGDARLEPARDNATAALHNLALAYARRAMLACLAGPAPTPTAESRTCGARLRSPGRGSTSPRPTGSSARPSRSRGTGRSGPSPRTSSAASRSSTTVTSRAVPASRAGRPGSTAARATPTGARPASSRRTPSTPPAGRARSPSGRGRSEARSTPSAGRWTSPPWRRRRTSRRAGRCGSSRPPSGARSRP